MFAIPLQGFAAATMLFCGTGKGHATTASPGAQHEHRDHDHSVSTGPTSPAEVQAKASSDLPEATAKPAAHTVHKCEVCSSCCHLAAISESIPLAHIAPVPQADIAAPTVALQSRPARVPDKPPRA